MALIVKTFHEYQNCPNRWGSHGKCERPVEGWVCVVSPELVEFAQPYCANCGRRNLGDYNRINEEQGRAGVWMFVPAAWQVDILTRNKYAYLDTSLAAQGIVAQPQADARHWPVVA